MSSINPPKTESALQSIRSKPSQEIIRLYSRKEFHIVDTSFDVYYRENPVGIPFLWESRPGTPKIKTREFPLPPLTPPPSFHGTPISKKKTEFQHSPSSSALSQRRVSRIEEDERESRVSTLWSPNGCTSNIIRLLLS